MQNSQLRDIDVLMVEDNESDVELCSKVLVDEMGCRLHVARTLRQARIDLESFGPTINLLLVDLAMTNGDGVRFLVNEVKPNPKLSRMYYAVLTGVSAEDSQNACEMLKHHDDIRYVGFYTKPLPSKNEDYRSILTTLISHYLEMRKLSEPHEPKEPTEMHEPSEPRRLPGVLYQLQYSATEEYAI